MASLQIPSASGLAEVRERPRVRVSVKRAWADDWSAVPYLVPLACSDVAGPGVPWATFRWAAGEIKWEDELAFTVRRPQALRDWFVRIEVLASGRGFARSTLWVGRICDEALAAHGTDGTAGSTVPTGDQDLAAFGLAHELDRNAIVDSVCTEDGTTSFRVDADLVFNGAERRGAGEYGNRSAAAMDVTAPDGSTRSAFAFSDARDGADEPYAWTARNVIQYLLNAHGPANVRFRLGGQVDAIQDLVVPPTRVYGRTVFEVLNDVLDRRLGLGWRVVTNEDAAEGDSRDPEIQISTVTGEDVKFGDATLPAAANQADLFVENYRREIAENRISLDTMARYGRIVVAGEPVLVCFSVDGVESLRNGWTPAEEASYKDGAGNAGTDDAAKDANDAARAGNDALGHVYTRFLVNPSWRWWAGATKAPSPIKKNANGTVDVAGGFDMGAAELGPPVRKWGRRAERWLPLRKPTGTAGSEPEYGAPLVVLLDDRDDDKSKHRWFLADRAPDGTPRGPHVRPLDRDFGFEVRFNPAHAVAQGRWSGAKSTRDEPLWSTGNMIATLAARTDERLTVTVDLDGRAQVDRTKLIDVPGAELWWVVEGTVIGVNADGVLEQTAGEILRNDAPRLRRIAAFAQAWYGKPRASLRVTFREMRRQFHVGLYVRQVSDAAGIEAVNSTVTRVTWDLVAMTTTIETQFGEMDFVGAGGGSRGQR